MLGGELYDPTDAELTALRQHCRRLNTQYNNLATATPEERAAAAGSMLGQVGRNVYIEPPFRCDYGCNIQVGDNFYCNFDCLMLDSAPIIIGNNVMLGPGVHIYTPCHPLPAAERASGREFAREIRIGNDVWIGGRAVICPGVTIGNGAVIGAGAVVTRDVPSDTVVAGNPARPIRRIEQAD